MKAFIELTNFSTPTKIYLNPLAIESFEKTTDNDGTEVKTTHNFYYVRESSEKILEQIIDFIKNGVTINGV